MGGHDGETDAAAEAGPPDPAGAYVVGRRLVCVGAADGKRGSAASNIVSSALASTVAGNRRPGAGRHVIPAR